MRTLGLLGGMSWESTAIYYQHLNRGVRERLGGLHSARLLLASVDFADIEAMQSADRWDDAGSHLAAWARSLQAGGAEALLLCTNTMHRVIAPIADAVTVPVLHIADATADALLADHVHTVGLLGTRYTMEQDFYTSVLRDRGLKVLTPSEPARTTVHDTIYDELCLGVVREESRRAFLAVVEDLRTAGAQAVILGCTEIGMLLDAGNCPLPVYDTTLLHVKAALDWALA
ncbi:aspartate/glutamate racemase family protein [Catenulispora subtropica]|uniref:Aspartate/glutamate racemase family protein n=1 Tax=Catenulispora subtropica TaxID=450798 RepID=A0ABN2T7Z1_9ACTN